MYIDRRERIDKKTGKVVVSYCCFVFHPGLKKRFTKTFSRQSDAKSWGLDMETKIRGGESVERPEDITVGQLADMYLARFDKERTRLKRKVGVNKWVAHFGKNKIVRLITRRDVRDYARKLNEAGYKSSSIGTYMSSLKAALNLAVEDEYIKVSPAAGKIPGAPKGKRTKEIRVLTFEEHQRLLSAAPERYHTLIYVWPLLGLRIGEMLGLKWEDVDLTARTLRVERQWQEQTGFCDPKCDSKRTVNLSRKTAQALREWKLKTGTSSNDHGLVFPGARGGVMEQKNLRAMLTKAAVEAEIEGFTPHVFRHTFGSWLLDGGVRNIGYIANQLGDTLEVIIKTYLHDRSYENPETADVLDRIGECNSTATHSVESTSTAEP